MYSTSPATHNMYAQHFRRDLMTMRKTSKKLVAVLVALVMMVSCVSVASFALWGKNQQGWRTAQNMVVLGDSIPSGYGMHGDPGNAYTLGNQFTFGHGGFVQGTYPQLVADELGVQNRYNYSRDAFRSVEIRRLLDPQYEAWLEQIENAQEHFISDAIMLIANVGLDERAAMAAEMQQTIRQADIIVLNFGNNDGGTYGFLAPFLKTMYYTYGLGLETAIAALRGQVQMVTTLDQLVQVMGGYADFMTEMEIGKQRFFQNYDAIVGILNEMNPNAEIYYMGMYDCFKDLNPQENDLRKWASEQAWAMDTAINNYVAHQSPWANRVHFVDCHEATMWQTADFLTPQYFINFLISVHPDDMGHKYMAGQLLKAIHGVI